MNELETERLLLSTIPKRIEEISTSLEELKSQIWAASGIRDRVLHLEYSLAEFQRQMLRYEQQQKEIALNSQETLDSVRELSVATRSFEEHIRGASGLNETISELKHTSSTFKEQFEAMNDWKKWFTRLVIAALVPSMLSFIFLVSVKVYNDLHRPPQSESNR